MTAIHPALEARRVLLPPSGMSTAEWGPLNHRLDISTSAYSGPWSVDTIPVMRGILDALDDDSIREVVIQKPSQEAGSETILVWLKRVAAEDPGPAMWVFADEGTAKKFCETRIQPAFRACPALAGLIDEAHFNQDEIRLKNGFSLVMTWASSIAKTASVPVRYLILDEICKPAYSKTQGEGGVIRRIRQRTSKFPNHKIVMLSSVTIDGDNMAKQMARTDAAFDYNVPCPHCDHEQPLAFKEQKPRPEDVKDRDDHPATEATGEVVFPKDGADSIRAEAARYRCRSCGTLWTSAEKNRAVPRGRWKPRSNSVKRPRRAGFFFSRLVSLSNSGRFETLVEDFLTTRGDPEELQSFVNNALGEHFKQTVKEISAKSLEARKWKLPPLVCPEGTIAITAGIDVQKVGMFHSCWAWRYDLAKDRLLGSMVYHGFLPTWGDLTNLIFKTQFRVQGTGETIGIWRAGIDTGGATDEKDEDGLNRTEETYYWLKQNSQDVVFGTKGMSKNTKPGQLIRHSVLEVKAGEMSIGTIVLWLLDTTRLKERVVWRLESTDEDPEPVNFHSETDEDFFKQLRGEQKIRDSNGHVKWVKKGANHYFDATIIAHACADFQWAGGVPILAAVMQQTGGQKHEDRGHDEDRDGGWTSGGRSSRGSSRGWLSRR